MAPGDDVHGSVTVTHKTDGLTVTWWYSPHLQTDARRQLTDSVRKRLREQRWPDPMLGPDEAIELRLDIRHVPRDVVDGMDNEPFGGLSFELRLDSEADDEAVVPQRVLWDALTTA